MIIKKLILKGYRRFSLSNIDILTYTPENALQIILATNGAGKSSLVRECSPLPSDLKKDFKEDGYKYIEIEHNNKNYILSSGYVSHNKHSFIVDGIEYNDSGIKKVQLQLVEEHFTITPNIQEILIGNISFTSMSTSERKKWLTLISNIDYTYPISVYEKLKQRHRDIVGAVKIIQHNLVQADIKILDNDVKEKLKTDIKYLNEFITILLSNKSTTQEYVQSKYELKNLVENGITLLSNINQYENINIENIDAYLVKSKADIENNAMLVNKINKELIELDVKDTASVDKTEYDKLIANKKYLTDKIVEIEKMNTIGIDLNNIKVIQSIFNYIYSDYIAVLNNISDLSDIYYSNDEYNKLNNDIGKLKEQLALFERVVNKYKTEKEHMEEHKDDPHVVCEKCDHSWNIFYNKIAYDKLIENIATVNHKIEAVTKTITEKEELFNKYSLKKDYILVLKNMIDTNSEIKTLFTTILGGKNIQTEIGTIISESNRISVLLQIMSEYTTLKDSLTELNSTISIIDNTNDIQYKNKIEKKKILEEELINLNKLKFSLLEEYKKLHNHKNSLINIKNLFDNIKASLKDEYKAFTNEFNKMKNDVINSLISDLKLIVSDLEKTIYDSDVLNSKIEQTKKELEQYKKIENVLKLAIKELSPKEGLIAKSINSFLNVFINEINHILNSIWSYEIRLLPCNVSEDNDLDYYFPVKIDNNETIEDINKGSSSMKEIIDLAFKIVFMKYLGLFDYPLVLDEFGKTMDPVHRISSFGMIENVLVNNFSQVFLISHFESMYGSLTNKADISILNSDNLNLDKELNYNTQMIIS